MSIKILDRKGSLGLSLSSEPIDESEEMEDDEEEDTSCGMGSFRPSWLQRLNNPKSFLVNNGILGLLNGATFTYFIGCISTLEKRFTFETKTAGIIMISEEISPICFGFLFGYFGSRSHRTRFLATAMTVGVISSFVMASPYFFYGAIRDSTPLEQYVNKTDFELCDLTEKDYFCNKSPTITVVFIFMLGTIIKGFAVNAFNTIGLPYLDDNIKKKNTPMYFASSMIIQLLGPAFGFLLSSLCLQFYEDPFHNPGYGTDDPRWIGAWWLGYVIIGTLMFTCSLPMWLFPRRFPGMKLPKALRRKEGSSSIMGTLKSMGSAVKRLFKNPILVCHQLGGILRVNGNVGYFILMPKYMEMQFRQTASEANLFSGPVTIGGMMLGILLGGILVQKFKPRSRVLTLSLALAETFSLLLFLIAMLISCSSANTGKTDPFINSLVNLDNDCNRDCLCTTEAFTPICGSDEKTTYFSPCYAGCDSYNTTGEDEDDQIYLDCKCLKNDAGNFMTGDATSGYCNFDCQWMLVYVVVISIGKFISSITSVPNSLVLFRCVNPADKSVALGALSGLYSILAFLPFPLIYGALSDSCCLIWEQSCGKSGNCWVYDLDKFRYMLHGVSAVYLVLGNIMDFLVWYLSPRLKNLYSDEETEAKDDKLNLDEKSQSNANEVERENTSKISIKTDDDTNDTAMEQTNISHDTLNKNGITSTELEQNSSDFDKNDRDEVSRI